MSISALFRDIGPRAGWGDHFYSWLRFKQMHRRFPRRNTHRGYADHLYRIKVDGSLLDPLRQFVSDKEYVKYYVHSTVGRQYVVETIQVLTSRSEVDTLTLQKIPCVVKPTHLSGCVEICTMSRQCPNKDVMRQWFHMNHYDKKREQNYRHLRPKIIVEDYFSEDGETPPRDYKIFCFNGTPRFVQVDSNRFSNHIQNFYNVHWTRINITLMTHLSDERDAKPPALERMLEVAAALARPFSFMRVDLYAVGDVVKVGELTNCPGGADHQFRPLSAEREIGRMFESDGASDLSSYFR